MVDTQNPEGTSKSGALVKGMMQVEGKNIVQNLQSTKSDWDSLQVPKAIQLGLLKLSYNRPSIIQAFSLQRILQNKETNFAFQSINGSGKTGAYIVPSLMTVDPAI
jgi:superfamily II DNA/RNA helicase